jgi:hypothetical protein
MKSRGTAQKVKRNRPAKAGDTKAVVKQRRGEKSGAAGKASALTSVPSDRLRETTAERIEEAVRRMLRYKLPLITHPAGEEWYRIHYRTFDPIFLGPPDGSPPRSRFDDPRSEYRVCYLGCSPNAVVAETLLHSPSRRILNLADLRKRSFATVRLQRTVRLVQLHGPGLNMLDITSDVVDGDLAICGDLARALYERSDAVDGLEYRCRHDNGEAIVERMKREDGIKGLILGGTELPLLLRDANEGKIPFLETTKLHVERIVEGFYRSDCLVSRSAWCDRRGDVV